MFTNEKFTESEALEEDMLDGAGTEGFWYNDGSGEKFVRLQDLL